LIVITGTGRSGTTFIAYLLHNLGFDLGHATFDMDWVKNSPFYGCGEDDCCVKINEQIHDVLVNTKRGIERSTFEFGIKDNPPFIAKAKTDVEKELEEFPHWDGIVKDPRFAYCLRTWLTYPQTRIDLILDCQRDIVSCAKSMLRTKKHPGPLEKTIEAMQNMREYLDQTIEMYGIPRYTIQFPEVVDSPDQLERLFSDYESFRQKDWSKVVEEHAKLADKTLVHH